MTHVNVRVFLSCLVAGVFARGKAESLKVLSGSCILIPCEFVISPIAGSQLTNGTCGTIWKSVTRQSREFDSRRSKEKSVPSNGLHGKVVGDLRERNCSTLLDDVPLHYDNDKLQFQLECDDQLIYTLGPTVHLVVKDSAPQPVIHDRIFGKFEEGTLVDLGCRAPVLCPTLPPLLTWSPQLGKTTLRVDADFVLLSMKFKASYLHNNAKMTCSAIYRRQAGHAELSSQSGRILQVLFHPKFLESSSRCREESSGTFCSCVSRANPPPKLTWELSGMPLDPSGHQLEEKSLDSTTRRSDIFLKSFNLNNSLVCISCNSFGSFPFSSAPFGCAQFAFNTPSKEPQKNVIILTLSAVKVILILGLPVLLWYFCRKTKVNSPASDERANDSADRSPTPEELIATSSLVVSTKGGKKMKHVAGKIFLLCALLEGCVCQVWATMLPSSVQTLSNSCLFIPCTFTIPPSFDQHLDETCAVVWRRSNRISYTDVFNSKFTREESDRARFLQGNLLGKLLEKNCSTLLEGVSSDNAGRYILRLECDNMLKFNFGDFVVEWQIQDAAPQPTIAPSRVKVTEGTALALECQAPVLCPTLPPLLTWAPRLGEVADADARSVMTFTATHHHDDVRVTCSALYGRQAGYPGLSSNRGLTLRVLYGPKYTNVSYDGPAIADTSLTLTCESNANPPPFYVWYLAVGGQVTAVSAGNRYTLTVTEDEPTLVCSARNAHGEQNSSVTVQVQFAPRDTAVKVGDPILEGEQTLLQCRSRAKPPVHRFNWSKDGIEVSEFDGELFDNLLLLYSARPQDSGSYRCVAQNALGTETSAAVLLDVQYPPKNTLVSAWPSGALRDGSEVTLRCNGEANPAIEDVRWYRLNANAGVKTRLNSGAEISFLVAKLSGDTYYCENRNIHGVQLSPPIAINVTFAPEILKRSHCQDVSIGTQCFCFSQGNPPPKLQWESSNVLVNHSNQRPITEQDLDQVTRSSIILLKSPDNSVDSLVCVSLNQFGSVRLAFNSSLPAPQTNVTVLVSSAVGLLVLLILSLLLLVYICRKTRINSQAGRQANFLGANKSNGSQAAILAPEAAAAAATDNEEVHYADVHVSKKRSRPTGEIRGLSSVTQEYAEIRLRSTAEMEQGREPGDKMAADSKPEPEEEMMTDSPFGPEDAEPRVEN
ncbi:uncharacterized protein LOC144072650 [Stigmatopora argus]